MVFPRSIGSRSGELQDSSSCAMASRLAASRSSSLSGWLAPGLGEVGPAAAAAAHDRRELLHQLARVDPAGEVGGDGNHELDLVVRRRAEHHHPTTEGVLQRVGQVAERGGVEVVDLPGQDPDVANLHDLAGRG